MAQDSAAPATQALSAPSVSTSAFTLSKLANKLGSGAVAGITGTLIIYPLDIVKTRLQNQRPNSQGVLPYRNGAACFRAIIANEGARGLYRGLAPNLVGITPEKAIKLAVNDFVRQGLAQRQGIAETHLSPVSGIIAGATAGFCQVIATNPMEIVKIQMQVAGMKPNAPKPSALGIVRQLGLRGLYRGTPATLLRDVPFSVLFFPSHALLKSYLEDPVTGQTPFWGVFASGMAAAFVASGLATPADVIKTRLQVTNTYQGISDCFKDIVAREGPRALFKGWVPRCCIVSPLFGIALLTYELQQRWFGSCHA